MQDLPPTLMRSITWDQGTEIARHLATTDKVGAPVYFCDSRSPWQITLAARHQRKHQRTAARLLPQGRRPRQPPTDSPVGVEHELNHRPCKVLEDRCPADLFTALLASQSPSVLRR
jgi:IS30 family transposase